MSLTISQIVNILKLNIPLSKEDERKIINGVNNLNDSLNDQISFFHNIKYIDKLKKTNARACFVDIKFADLIPKECISLVTKNPYKDFILISNYFHPKRKSNGQISKHSFINNKSTIGKNVEIQEGVIVKGNVMIGDNTIVCSNSVIGNNSYISSDVVIESNCSITNCKIGKKCLIQSGAVIGSDGFGFAIDNKFTEIKHIGEVQIGENVNIGCNTSIARGSLKNTIIGNNVRIDNLVQIAHNVQIGNNCIIASQSGIAGSTIIGNNVIIGGQVGIAGHLKIGNNVKIAGKSGVIKNVQDNSVIGGYPAQNIRDWHRSTIKLKFMK